MNFLEKLSSLMQEQGLNNSTLSKHSGVPYTTIDGFYKKGYEGARMSTIKKLSAFFDVSLDYLMDDNITDKNYGKDFNFIIAKPEIDHIKKYRKLDPYGQEAVDSILEIEYKRCTAEPKEAPNTNETVPEATLKNPTHLTMSGDSEKAIARSSDKTFIDPPTPEQEAAAEEITGDEFF